jgi:hypothetical protein
MPPRRKEFRACEDRGIAPKKLSPVEIIDTIDRVGGRSREQRNQNPMKRKPAVHPIEWAWISFSFYSARKQGLIRIDPVI